MRDAIAVLAAAAAVLLLSASAHSQEAPATPSVIYSETTPEYRFYPGDEIEITVFSAPELTRTVTVGPDGRIALPLIGAVRASDLSASELHDRLVTAYASHLRMPELTVTPRSYGSRQVFVGGEVARPGIYEMPAQLDDFQAV